MKARILIFTGIFFCRLALAYHPVHVSVVNMDLLSDSNMIKYSICLYSDDFQSLINFKYKTLINFSHQYRMTFKEQRSILDYINTSFQLRDSQNKSLSSDFLSWKLEDNMIWLFFCVKRYHDIEKLTIENRLMLDLYMDQKNLLIINKGDEQEGFEFTKRDALYTVILRND